MAVTIKGFASDWSVPEPAKGPLGTALSGTFATLDSQGRQPVRKGELVLNVMDYGAIGDGVADDTAACQAAIDAAPPHATVMFPGNHLITAVTLNKPHIKLVGPGTIYQGKIVIGTTGTRQDLYWAVDGLTFERSAIADNTYGIELLKGRRGTVQNCTFFRHDKAIYVNPLANGDFHDTAMVKIKSNEFDQVRYALYVDRAPAVNWMNSSDFKFIANTINLALITPVYAVSIDGIVISDNVTFFPSYNNTNATLKADKMKNIYLGESDWVVISGNNFFESGVEAIHLERPRHFTISDNLIAWPGQRVMSDAIRITGDAPQFGSISGNVISRFTGNAVGVYGTGGGLLSVKDNVLEYSAAAATYYGTPGLSTVAHYGVFRASTSTVKVVESSNEATGGIFSNQGGALTSRTWVTPDSILGGFRAQIPVTAADTPILTLNSTQGGTTAFTGLLIIEVKNVDAQTNVNSSSYVYHVSKHALGVSATKISEHGLLTGNSANWPSFTFTLSSTGKLLATPVASTSGTFFFMVTFQGDLAALPA